jgi:hypothetical protein
LLPASSRNKAPDLRPAFIVLVRPYHRQSEFVWYSYQRVGRYLDPLAVKPDSIFPSCVSQSTSSTLCPSATEQQGPLRLARLSNHCLSGEFAYFPSRSRVRPNPGKNNNDNAAQQLMPRLAKAGASGLRLGTPCPLSESGEKEVEASVICTVDLSLMHGRHPGQLFGPRLTKSSWTEVQFRFASVRLGHMRT